MAGAVRKHLASPLLALFLAGCIGAAPSSLGDGENLYVDGRLGFAMEHPLSWSKVRSAPSTTTVRWQAPGRRRESSPSGAVTSLAGEAVPVGAEELLERYRSERPEFRIVDRTERNLPAGRALQILADAPGRRYLIFFLTDAGSAFILEFAATPDDFPRHLSLFQEMAESFIPLTR